MDPFVEEEENPDRYVPGGLHPVHLNDEYHNGRYKVLRKLGHGRPNPSQQPYELSILQHLSTADPSHPGFPFIPQLRDHFEITGPNGTHVCLVLDPMGETLSGFTTLWDPTIVPTPVAKRFTWQLLLALDYAHAAGFYSSAHSDIKPDNIMVQIKDLSTISTYVAETPIDPAHLNDPAVLPSAIQSHTLGAYYITSSVNELDICLGDWGAAGWAHEEGGKRRTPVQPVLLRAPEVVISAPWGAAVDIWNLGAVLLELVDGVHMFDGRNGRDGRYDVKKHVEEMVRLFGRFPKGLLDCGDGDVVARCFRGDGSVVEPEREGTSKLEDWVVNIGGEEKEAFVAFLRRVMVIDPGKRKTAAELVDDPWLQIPLQGETSSGID
ncbi:hypothetical protein V493_03243 [Pseudogymnoascus sp. VKM F-4281 (FW-2241)]|nr:hypothetical protein V493_03243 [Pseudogymnoascus sp. VKM F-4281 (FW-2241)]